MKLMAKIKALSSAKTATPSPAPAVNSTLVVAQSSLIDTSLETTVVPCSSDDISSKSLVGEDFNISEEEVEAGSSARTTKTGRSSFKTSECFAKQRSTETNVDNQINNLNIEQVLSEDRLAQQTLQQYEKDQYLNTTGRTVVVHVVCAALIKISPLLKNCHLNTVADKIVSLFPSEDKNVYFVGPKTRPDQAKSTGKLRSRYDLLKGKLLAGIKGASAQPSTSSASSSHAGVQSINSVLASRGDVDAVKYKESEEWLKYQDSPFSRVREHWLVTAPKRLRELPDTAPTSTSRGPRKRKQAGTAAETPQPKLIADYYKKWSILKHPSGYQLLGDDFAYLYPEYKDKLFGYWEAFSEKVQVLAESEITDEFGLSLLTDLQAEDISQNARVALISSLLFSVCKVTARIPYVHEKKNIVWKVSTRESREAFILHVPTVSAVRERLVERNKFLLARGLRAQPQIVVAGPSLKNLTNHMVVIDSITYNLPNLLVAIDTCFKAIFALNAQYPPECEHVWLLIQRCVYGITTKYDNNNLSNVFACLNRLAC